MARLHHRTRLHKFMCMGATQIVHSPIFVLLRGKMVGFDHRVKSKRVRDAGLINILPLSPIIADIQAQTVEEKAKHIREGYKSTRGLIRTAKLEVNRVFVDSPQ